MCLLYLTFFLEVQETPKCSNSVYFREVTAPRSETRTVANVSTDVSVCISISSGDGWGLWQPGLVCPQLETGGPLSSDSGYSNGPQCASHTHKHTY